MTANERRRRRPAGSGSVRNRGTERTPRWFAYHWVMIEGERRQVSKGPFRRRSEAEDWLKDELQRSREGRPTLPSKITVAELLDEWLMVRQAERWSRTRTPSTPGWWSAGSSRTWGTTR